MITSKELKRAEKQLGALKHKAPLVVSRSLNRAIAKANTTFSRESRKEYHLKAKTIKETITVKKATRAALKAVTVSRGQRLGLKHFKVIPGHINRQNPEKSKPIKVAVKKDGGTKELRHAFITEKLNDHIFERKTEKRLPIKKLTSVAVPQTFKNPEVRRKVRKDAMEAYYKRFDHEIKRIRETSK